MSIRQTGLLALFALIAYPMWVTGGTQPAWQFPLPILAAILFVVTLVVARRDLWRDPVTLTGALFMLLLLVQWANSGREPVFDPLLQAWTYGPPPVSWLPSSVSRPDAAEMFRWFFPAWTIALAVRHLIPAHHPSGRRLLNALMYAAAALAAAAIMQFVMAGRWGIGTIPSESYFVTSFGYANQGGAFFVLCFCITLGRTLSLHFKRQPPARQIPALICCLLCLGGGLVSLSRSAILLSLAVVIIAAVYIVLYRHEDAGRAIRFDRILLATAVAITAFLLFQPMFGEAVTNELQKRYAKTAELHLPANWTYSAVDNIRPLYRRVAIRIFRDHPWFGAGGWAVRHLGFLHVPLDEQYLLQTPGAANTHNDLLQWLSEFGLAGMALLWMSAGILAAPLVRRRQYIWPSPRLFFTLTGLTAVAIHSFVDLPFRSPAVLFLWTLTLGLAAGTFRRPHGGASLVWSNDRPNPSKSGIPARAGRAGMPDLNGRRLSDCIRPPNRIHHHPMNRAIILCLAALGLAGAVTIATAREPVAVATLVWDPYISTNTLHRGPATDIVAAAFEHGGYEAHITHMPWKQSMELTLAGTYHAIYPAYFSLGRMQKFLISDPFLCSPVVLVARADSTVAFDGLDSLVPYRIGIVAGYANAEAFDDATHLTKIVHGSDLACLLALKAGHIDLATADKLVAMALIRNHADRLGALEDYRFLTPALGNRDLYMMFPKSLDESPRRLEGFNQGLEKLRAEGMVEAIIRAYGFR